MKKVVLFLTLSLFIFASCENDEQICTECNGVFSETLTMYIYEEKGPCEDGSGENCLYEQHNFVFDENAWVPFNQDICGFDYLAGYRYEISVKRKQTGKDDEGNRIYQYCLINIVSAVKVYL